MSNERDVAKQNATAVTLQPAVPGSTSDERIEIHASADKPRMREAMNSADQLKSELQQQQHIQKMKTKERGWFGIVFGTESLASIIIAAVVILLSFVTVMIFEWAGFKSGHFEFWSHEAQPVWAIITAALGFIFGRSNHDPSS